MRPKTRDGKDNLTENRGKERERENRLKNFSLSLSSLPTLPTAELGLTINIKPYE